jgi:ribonuclease E
MASNKHQREVENKLQHSLKYDRARVQLGRISRFGLLEMSRQRLRPSLGESSQLVCPRCEGHGRMRSVESLSLSILRIAEEHAMKENTGQVLVQVPTQIGNYLLNEKRRALGEIEQRHDAPIVIVADDQLETPHYEVTRIRENEIGEESNKPSYMRGTPRKLATHALTKAHLNIPNLPAVTNVRPAQPAPVREEPREEPVAAPAPVAVAPVARPAGGIGGFFKRLFGGGEPVAAAPAPTARSQEERGRNARDGRRDARDGRGRTPQGGRDNRREEGRRDENRRDQKPGQQKGPQQAQQQKGQQPQQPKQQKQPKPPRDDAQREQQRIEQQQRAEQQRAEQLARNAEKQRLREQQAAADAAAKATEAKPAPIAPAVTAVAPGTAPAAEAAVALATSTQTTDATQDAVAQQPMVEGAEHPHDAHADAGEAGGRRRRGRRGGRRRRRGQGGAEGEAGSEADAQGAMHDDADSGEVVAQHRSQPEFDFEDDFAPAPVATQPAEAAAAPQQAAAHDAQFAQAPVEHDVERTSQAETNVESAATAWDDASASTPGAWTDAPIANESVADAAPTQAEAEPVEAAPAPQQPAPVVEAQPASEAQAEETPVVVHHDAQRDMQDDTIADVRPAPGLFDAMPAADPAQAAADAAEDAKHEQRNA